VGFCCTVHTCPYHTYNIEKHPEVSAVNGITGPHEALHTQASGSAVFSQISKQEAKMQEEKNLAM